jgi:hypothetical protein
MQNPAKNIRTLLENAMKDAKVETKTTTTKTNANVVVMIVYGLGCRQKSQVMKERHHKFAKIKGECVKKVGLYCEPTLMAQLRAVIQSLTTSELDPSTSVLVAKLVQDIIQEVNEGHTVVLVGHSQGGSVAARVGEILARTADQHVKKQVSILTLASIYTPPRHKVRGIDIRDVTYTTNISRVPQRIQIALRKRKKDAGGAGGDGDGGVMLHRPAPRHRRIVDAIKVHADYKHIIEEVVKTGKIDLALKHHGIS